jgi:hypothetical protein
MDITILGIESSCDDTSAAVIRNTTLLSNVIASQAVHMKYGGVIPELASRAHQQNIVPVVDTALKEAGIAADEVDAIAFTRGPGLLGSLLVQRVYRLPTTFRSWRSITCKGTFSRTCSTYPTVHFRIQSFPTSAYWLVGGTRRLCALTHR